MFFLYAGCLCAKYLFTPATVFIVHYSPRCTECDALCIVTGDNESVIQASNGDLFSESLLDTVLTSFLVDGQPTFNAIWKSRCFFYVSTSSSLGVSFHFEKLAGRRKAFQQVFSVVHSVSLCLLSAFFVSVRLGLFRLQLCS
jgi:hypothetical protein